MTQHTHPAHTLFPEERLNASYPIQLWAIGWLAILKACIWLFTDPLGPPEQLRMMGIRYLVMMVPLLILGPAIFNKKKWAIWGMMVACIGEIIFFLVFRGTLQTLVPDTLTTISLILSIATFVLNGPISDIAILILLPFTFRFTA